MLRRPAGRYRGLSAAKRIRYVRKGSAGSAVTGTSVLAAGRRRPRRLRRSQSPAANPSGADTNRMEPSPIRAARAGLVTSSGAAAGKGTTAPARRWAIAARVGAVRRAPDGAAAGERDA